MLRAARGKIWAYSSPAESAIQHMEKKRYELNRRFSYIASETKLHNKRTLDVSALDLIIAIGEYYLSKQKLETHTFKL